MSFIRVRLALTSPRRPTVSCIVSESIQRRLSSSLVTSEQERALDDWISETLTATRTYYDDIPRSKVADIYCTLPTRNRNDDDYESLTLQHLPAVHSLAFFHPRKTETLLGEDKTERDFCPPSPFTRRMWAGGAFRFPGPDGSRKTLKIGEDSVARARIGKIEKKGFEKDTPMVFVHQNIDYAPRKRGVDRPLVSEERIHVYLPRYSRAVSRGVRGVSGLPKPQYTFSWTPTPTTLFRFSALTWNGHLIHLDREYARNEEGYPERLVHGPLTALILVEALNQVYRGRFDNYVYRARNPTVVGRQQHLHVAKDPDGASATLWSENDDGVVGMTGVVNLLDRGGFKL